VLGIFGLILGLITLGICFMYHENAFAVSFILPDLIVLWSGVYYPINVFPEVMQTIAHFFPSYYGFEILKASVGIGTINIPWLIGTMLLWLVGAVLFLSWAKKYTMKKGLFAKLN
jgi:ABC-type polysaccharide/polyol phosphate export permease